VRMNRRTGDNERTQPVWFRLASFLLASTVLLAMVPEAFSQIANTVTARATPLGTTDEITATDDETVDVVDETPVLFIEKSADVSDVDSAGDAIIYSVLVRNNGNVTLQGITLTDTLLPLTCPTSGDDTVASLGPEESETCTATYTVLQADLDQRGANDGSGADNEIDNEVAAVGQTLGGISVTDDDSAAVALVLRPEIQIVKDALLNDTEVVNNQADADETITYTFTVTNSGNVTLSNVRVNDTTNATNGPVIPDNATLVSDNGTVNDSTDTGDGTAWSTLGPGDIITFTATYTVVQQDVDTLQ